MIKRTMPRKLYLLTAFLGATLFALLPTAFASAATHATPSLIGVKSHYLALGDSLAFGFQPDLDLDHGYATDFAQNLEQHGSKYYDNMGCPGETAATMISGNCLYPELRKFPYIGSQLTAAEDYLRILSGQVSPITLDIGANDLLPDINAKTCAISPTWSSDLAKVDANLTQTILPGLSAALTVNGQRTGDLLLMNYYDPYQNQCPASIPYIQQVNQHLAADAQGYATVVDVFDAFGGTASPNPNTCNYTWVCSLFHDIHSTNAGYSTIATAFEQTTGY